MINECLGKYDFQLANQELRYNSACGVNQPISCFRLHELFRESCIEFTLEASSFKVYIYDLPLRGSFEIIHALKIIPVTSIR